MEYDNKKDSTIESLAFAGMSLSVLCVIQFFIFFKLTALSSSMLILYILNFTAYLLLFRVKSIYFWFIIACSALMLIRQAVFFYLILAPPIVLTVFNAVVLVYIHIQQLHPYIRWVENDRKSPVEY